MIKNISNLGDAAVYCNFGSEVNEIINNITISGFINFRAKVTINSCITKIRYIFNHDMLYSRLKVYGN